MQRIPNGSTPRLEPFPQLESAPKDSNPNLLIRSQMLYPLSYGRLHSIVRG